MNRLAELPLKDRTVYFEQAAARLALPAAAVEKDFWVCWTLARLFSSERLAPRILFKGGTSLSKVFNLIRRFSEDIDLILDWNEVAADDPRAARSRTQQDRYNRELLERSRDYVRETFLPEVRRLVGGCCTAEVEAGAPDVIDIRYPSARSDRYLRPEIRLEIGPLAQWIPHATYRVKPYAAEVLPELFAEPDCSVQAIKAERTFWEKATILHAEAFREPPAISPARYSRHYYDLAMMAEHAPTRAAALRDLDLLHSVVEFKKKFYPRAGARYDLAKPGTFRLLPPAHGRESLAEDYEKMQVMLFGDAPAFGEILEQITIEMP
jgi:hypothetical protein